MIKMPSLKPSRTALKRAGGLLSVKPSNGGKRVGKGKSGGEGQRVTIGIYQVETRKRLRIAPMAVIILTQVPIP
jgi:hypothetical protein